MRKTIGLASLALAVLVALLVLVWHDAPQSEPREAASAAVSASSLPQSTARAPSPHLPEGPSVDLARRDLDPRLSGTSSPAPHPDYPVNLDELRRRLPDNLYWTLDAPTDDAALLRVRAERSRARNALYGKVLSNTATEAEIESYYAERRRVSEDYIRFSELVLAEHRGELPDDQVGLYELSIQLHRARLDDIPRDMSEALARRRAKRPN